MLATKKLAALAVLTAVALGSVATTALAVGRSDGSKPAPASVTKALANVPTSTLDRVGVGRLEGPKGFPITPLGGKGGLGGAQNEKVAVLSYNAAWCPHCAANSWPLAIALSRFGTLGGLRIVDTGTYYEKVLEAKPAYSHTKGISFIDATYSSPWVSFEPVVGYDVEGHKLQKLSGAQTKLVKSFDPDLGFPAVAIDKSYGMVGAGFSPGLLAGKGPGAIVNAAKQPSSPIAKGIDGKANVIAAAICAADGMQPEEVCASPGVEKASHRLPKE
jgi:Domain of unknown function (DUF929)